LKVALSRARRRVVPSTQSQCPKDSSPPYTKKHRWSGEGHARNGRPDLGHCRRGVCGFSHGAGRTKSIIHGHLAQATETHAAAIGANTH
jgi:hypothetical protein